MRISGDASVRGQFKKTKDGRLECDFPERMVVVSNHQVRLPNTMLSGYRNLTRVDLYRLGLPVVDRLRCRYARSPLHYS
jgi:hypothetical protein